MLLTTMRTILRTLHLYLGLILGLLVVLIGLSGSVLVWRDELDSLLNPTLLKVPATHTEAAGAQALSPEAIQNLVEWLQRTQPGRPNLLQLPEHPDDAIIAWYRTPEKRGTFTLPVSRQLTLQANPPALLGERPWGEFGLDRAHLIPTLYFLHRYLWAGETGKTLVGILGFVLMFLMVSGIWLYAPNWRELRKALQISFRGAWLKVAHLQHRRLGLWFAPILLFMGFSGSYFNLPQWYAPILGSPAKAPAMSKKAQADDGAGKIVSLASALQRAQFEFPEARISRVTLPPSCAKPYEIRMHQSGEWRQGDGDTRIKIDSCTGKLLSAQDPLKAQGKKAFIALLFPFHTGEALGLLGRILMTLTGLMPLFFFVSGFSMWRHKQRIQQQRALKPLMENG